MIQYDTIQRYNTIWYDTCYYPIRYDTIRYNMMLQYDMKQYGTVWCYNTIWYDTTCYYPIQYDTIRYNTTLQYDMIRYNKIRHVPILYAMIQYDKTCKHKHAFRTLKQCFPVWFSQRAVILFSWAHRLNHILHMGTTWLSG